MMKHLIITLLGLITVFSLFGQTVSRQANELRRFQVTEAKQAVAVDDNYFYVINNSTITKHNKDNGNLVTRWDGSSDGIKHLNSGVVIRGRLYCATSNYPDTPMAGSIEIFDSKTLKHIGNHSFGIFSGSATWIDKLDGYWYVGFAHYSGSGSSEGKDTRWTTVVKFNKKWQEVESWIFPKNLIELFTPMSNSGAAWGTDGKLYCTGHDRPELYVLEIPQTGYTLKHINTINIPVHGQGIAFDRTERNKKIIYGINRQDNLVIVFEID
jgi:hypothetical protein